jgi:hypothetical protein
LYAYCAARSNGLRHAAHITVSCFMASLLCFFNAPHGCAAFSTERVNNAATGSRARCHNYHSAVTHLAIFHVSPFPVRETMKPERMLARATRPRPSGYPQLRPSRYRQRDTPRNAAAVRQRAARQSRGTIGRTHRTVRSWRAVRSLGRVNLIFELLE